MKKISVVSVGYFKKSELPDIVKKGIKILTDEEYQNRIIDIHINKIDELMEKESENNVFNRIARF